MDELPAKFRRLMAPEPTPSGCWLWTGAKDPLGYGRVRWEGSTRLAHRVVYTLLVGPIPEGLVIDHLCRTPSCVSPAHMEPVTQAENIRRGEWSKGASKQQLAKDTCANGHPFTPENTYVPPLTSRRQRQCRICRLAAKRRYNAKRAVA